MATQTKKTTTKKPAAKTATKKVATKTTESKKVIHKVKLTPAPKAELYLVNGTKKLDEAHEFKKGISPIYGVEEYSWTGDLKKGTIKFLRPNGHTVPTNHTYNSGVTLIGKAISFFKISNALTVTAEGSCDQIINYGNPQTKLEYVGAPGKHTVYVRVYDNANGGDHNDRWIALSID